MSAKNNEKKDTPKFMDDLSDEDLTKLHRDAHILMLDRKLIKPPKPPAPADPSAYAVCMNCGYVFRTANEYQQAEFCPVCEKSEGRLLVWPKSE